MNPFLFLTLAGGALFLLNNYNKGNITSKTAQVSLTGIRINTTNIFSPYFELTFNVWNTVNSNLTLQAISGSVYYQGSPVAAIRYADSMIIKKGDNFITVKAIPNSLSVIQAIIATIGGKFTKELSVQGSAIINGVSVPLNVAI